MENNRIIRTSKFLSKHLRHQPERIGLTLETGGWVKVETLLAACQSNGMRLTHAELEEVVRSNDKQRFAFDETGERIRASQGHSVEVDLELPPTTPPPVLYHGTGAKSVESILQNGLERRTRQHVHLSHEVVTATKVGARHGKPVILTVNAAAMSAVGYLFYISANGVWLTDEVPAEYLAEL